MCVCVCVCVYLHEVLSSDEALSAECVDQSACMLLVLIGTVQGTHDDLTQHLWQEMLWSPHLSHTAHSLSQVLTVQVLSHDRLLKSRFNKVFQHFNYIIRLLAPSLIFWMCLRRKVKDFLV